MSFIAGRVDVRIFALSLVLWDPQFPIRQIHDIGLRWKVTIHCHHLSSAWRTSVTTCLFRLVNCLHMIYIIYQHNQVHKYEVTDETAVIYKAYIPYDSL